MLAAACGMMFNIMGYIHEWLKSNPIVRFDSDEPTMEMAERRDIVAGKTSRLLLTAPEPDDEAAADECVACGFPSDSGHALECPIANDMLPCNAELWHERLKQATNVCCFSCIFCNVPSYSDPCYSCLGLEKTTGIANQYWMPQPSKDDGDTDV